jgi:hypothetical protein
MFIYHVNANMFESTLMRSIDVFFFYLCDVQQIGGPLRPHQDFIIDAHLAYLDLDLDIIYPDPSLLRICRLHTSQF